MSLKGVHLSLFDEAQPALGKHGTFNPNHKIISTSMAEVLNVEKSETKNAITDRIQTNCYLHNREFAVAAFCDLESLTKFRIATDLP